MLGVLQEDVGHQHARQHDDDQPGLAADGAEGSLQLGAHGGSAAGQAHAGGDSAAADIPLAQALMHEHQCAGSQHVGDFADQNEEHGQLIHHQCHEDAHRDTGPQRQAVPQVHAHEHIRRAAGQRTGRHVKAVGGHGHRGRNAEHRGDGHGAQDVDHVVDRHEAVALEQGEHHKAQHQRDDGRPVQQEAEESLVLLCRQRIWFQRCLHNGMPSCYSLPCGQAYFVVLPTA